MSEPTLKFDASRKRMTVEFHEPPALETLEAISAQLSKNEARSFHAMVALGWRDPKAPDWDDPRHVAQLGKALNPSLEAFIFDVPFETVPRQTYDTIGDFSDVLEACPMLRRAFLTGCSTMRKTRHEHIRALHFIGYPLDPSIIPGLVASQFPALERLVLDRVPGIEEFPNFTGLDISQYPVIERRMLASASRMEELAANLRAIEAPRLSEIYIDSIPVIDFLTVIGRTALPWNLCVRDYSFDDVDGLFKVIEQQDALRSGKLRVDSEKFFDNEIAKLKEMGVTVEDSRDIFSPRAYSDW